MKIKDDGKQVWDALDILWAKTKALNPKKIETAVDKAVKEVRGERKSRRRA